MDAPTPLQRVAFSGWCMKTVSAANRRWREEHPGKGDYLMSRERLHFRIFQWLIKSGRIEDPGPRMTQSFASYAALAYSADPQAVVNEARRYYRELVAKALNPGVETEKAGRS